MGWKTINGRRYHDKSVREGGRAKSTYFGAGEAGARMAQMAAFDREDRAAEREEIRDERRESDVEETAVSDWFDQVQAVAEAAMIEAGFHKHKGQWRRKRPGDPGGGQRHDGRRTRPDVGGGGPGQDGSSAVHRFSRLIGLPVCEPSPAPRIGGSFAVGPEKRTAGDPPQKNWCRFSSSVQSWRG
jgi:hypothetical protein